jgi:guanylate kinase
MSSIEIARTPFLIVVSGPSGAGKSTVVDRILERSPHLVASVSVTTRLPRGDERDGVDYFFVERDGFERRREAGAFLEWAEVHGNLYGTPAAFVSRMLEEGMNVILEIDVQGGMLVRDSRPEAVLIFIMPPGFETLRERLRGRGTDDEEVIKRRLENARREISSYGSYDYIVVNDELERCADDCLAIIRAEALRRERTSVQGRRRAAGEV